MVSPARVDNSREAASQAAGLAVCDACCRDQSWVSKHESYPGIHHSANHLETEASGPLSLNRTDHPSPSSSGTGSRIERAPGVVHPHVPN
jgi:hypothetical protein